MQKYKSNITTTSGAAVRNVPVTVLKEDGSLASLFLDRDGNVAAPNPLKTGADGTFYFYAVNGRYGLHTTVDGVSVVDSDAVLLMDPEELTVAGPIATAVAAAEASALRAETAISNADIPILLSTAQNAAIDAGQFASEASASAALAVASKIAAASSESSALAAANSAGASLSEFKGRYYGALAEEPGLNPLGDAPADGDLYFDSANGVMRVRRGAAWQNYEVQAAASAAAAATQSAVAAAEAALAASAKTSAESARDAALIGAGVYADEPTGRAAVADGVAFKVQGAGEIAAYEYRRIDGAASSLIATYPSHALVEGVRSAFVAQAASLVQTQTIIVQHHAFN